MDVFDLYAKISLDTSEYEQGLERASGNSSSFINALGAGVAKVGKWAAAALSAASTAIGTIAKLAIDQYGDYEQLVGGVETLFKDSAGKVQQYANEAYQTAGLSANQYMETVTGFFASLLQSLDGDTARAADLADQAIRDMSDNANKVPLPGMRREAYNEAKWVITLGRVSNGFCIKGRGGRAVRKIEALS